VVGIYWLAALVGWPFVLFFLVSGGDVEADFDLDTDFDLDADADIDGVGSGEGALSAILSFLSFRAVAFFAAFFGLAGLLLTWIDTGTVLALVLSIGIGLFAFWLNGMLLRYLKSSSSDSSIRDQHVAGSPAVVTIPIRPGHRGRVAVEARGHRLVYTAAPYSSSDDGTYEVGTAVVIVEIEGGTAMIAPLDIDL
jgi:membrane protein implicated in regulation of membrane protease activity